MFRDFVLCNSYFFLMSPIYITLLVGIYFLLLLSISFFTSKNDNNEDFFKAGKKSPWYVVAFGMVGASLSGVTFISVPGWIQGTQFTYFQVVLGYLIGYFIVAYVLLPIYYKSNLTSIYEYLRDRFGTTSYKTGAFFFFISRVLGAAFRLFLVAIVLQQFVFDSWNVPFELTVVISIALIWLYTFRGGIKTIVWTDSLQTFFMIAAVILAIYFITSDLGWSISDFLNSEAFDSYSKVWVTDSFLARNYFLKSLIGGAFITITMTGLDQDMMQKNLSCKNLRDAQKNMIVMSITLVIVTGIFMVLGALLFTFAEKNHIGIPLLDGSPKTDLLFPEIALNSHLGPWVGIPFILGLIAAAYSSADSALTSLTTSFCVDFIGLEKWKEDRQIRVRKATHIGMSLLLVIVIIVFKHVLSTNIIDGLLTMASYTYGPLLGLYAFGIFSKHSIKDRYTWVVTLISISIATLIGNIPAEYLGGYSIGYELLPINGALTYLGLYLIRNKNITIK